MILLIYVIFFLTLFLQFPLNNSLPGNTDTLYAIAISNNYLNEITSFFSGTEFGRFLYPQTNIFQFGESSLIGAGIFLFYKIMGLSDLWAYYLFISTVYILTAYAISLLSYLYTRNHYASLFSGFAFCCSTFVLANIDDSVVIGLCLPALSAYWLKRFFSDNRDRYLIYSAILGGIQIYSNLYAFFYQTVMLLVIFCVNINTFVFIRKYRRIILSGIVYLIITLPFLIYHFSLVGSPEFYDFWTTDKFIDQSTLVPGDLLNTLQNNIIYTLGKPYVDDGLHFWMNIRKRAFIGALLPLLTIVGCISSWKMLRKKTELLVIAFLGIVLSMGIPGANEKVISFNDLVLKLFPSFKYLRVPLRGYTLFLLSCSILSAFGVCRMFKNPRMRSKVVASLFIALLIIGYLFEHAPLPMKQYKLANKIKAPAIYSEIPDMNNDVAIFDLPGSLAFGQGNQNLYKYNRELVYMIWQTQHRLNTASGVSSYYPTSRVKLQALIHNLDLYETREKLSEANIKYLVFHKHMILRGERNLEAFLDNIPFLEKVKEMDSSILYRVND